MRRSRGFTLMELFTVMVVVALLGAILFPVFARARDKARQATCLSNLKQLGMAHQMYWHDYDETTVTSWSFGFPGEFSWYVQPYIRNYKILLCPSYRASAEEFGAFCNPNYLPGHIDNPTYEPMMWGYGYNTGHQWINDTGLTRMADYRLSGEYQVQVEGRNYTARYRDVPILGIKTSDMAAPNRLLLLGDSSDTVVLGLGRHYQRPILPGDNACEQLRKAGWPRHNSGGNYVYADGHAAWHPYNPAILADGDPSVVPDVCAYFRDFDGTNNPGRCKNGLGQE
jgi:prepilin-type processing-associated H-X9-DG protein/prepilin-type N-terminal cleavage/methylation domain-containing protein